MQFTKDTSGWEKVKKQLLSLDQSQLRIGWFEGQRYGDDNENLPMAYVAALNEEGHTNGPSAMIPGAVTPARPFMRVGFNDYLRSGKSDQTFLKIVSSVLDGQTLFKAYTEAGPKFVRALQGVMDAWQTPPNSRLTQQLKGFNDPLNKTHQLIDNVSYEIGKD